MLNPGILTGTVQGTAWDGKLVRVLDEFEIMVKGEKRTQKRYWACWFSEAQYFQQGDAIEVQGIISAKVGERDRKREDGSSFKAAVVEWHLNECQVVENITQFAAASSNDDLPF